MFPFTTYTTDTIYFYNTSSNWKRRWFVFDKTSTGWSISYYKDEATTHKNKPPKGTITLILSPSSSSSVTQITSSKDYSVEILPGDGSPPLVIAAEDSVRFNEILTKLKPFVHEVVSGWLYKRARKSGRNWKKRYMQVDFKESVLRIFEDISSYQKANTKGSSANANDVIPFNQRSILQASGIRKFCLELIPKEGDLSLFVAAENQTDLVRWKLTFERLIQGEKTNEKKQVAVPNVGVVRQSMAPTTPPQTMKKMLSKKGSALFAQAVGHGPAASSPRSAPPKRRAAPPKRRSLNQKTNEEKNEDGDEIHSLPVQLNTQRNSVPPPRRPSSVPTRRVAPVRNSVPPVRKSGGRKPPPKRVTPQRKSVPGGGGGRAPPPSASIARQSLIGKVRRASMKVVSEEDEFSSGSDEE